MRYRLLGNTGLRVSELFLGTMAYGDPDGGVSMANARRIVDRFAEAGGNVVDTANFYGGGESERVVGELLAGRRDRFVLASKYTVTRDASDPNAGGNHRKNLIRSLEQSLRRLRTDYLDLYWVHMWDRHTPVAETLRALDDMVRAGMVRYVGVSNAPAWVVAHANTLAEWRGWTPFAGLQVPYSLLRRDIERDLLPLAEAFGLTVAAWHRSRTAHSPTRPTRQPTARPAARNRQWSRPSSRSPPSWGPTPRRWPSLGPGCGPGRCTRSPGPALSTSSTTTSTLSTSPSQARRSIGSTQPPASLPGYPTDFITAVEPSVLGDTASRVIAR